MLLATGVVRLIERRRFGVYLTAIREDEDGVRGPRRGHVPLQDAGDGALVVPDRARAGPSTPSTYLSLQPNSVFGVPLSVEIIIRPIVGGAGTLLGPILGSFILTPLAELSRAYFGQGGWHGAHLIAYGVLLIARRALRSPGRYPWLGVLLSRAVPRA